MAKSKTTPEESSELSFEAAIASLEQVVRKLESGTLPLEQMLSEYAKAVEYIQLCHRQLDGARRRIAQLQNVDGEGKASTKDWDDTAPVVGESREAPGRRKNS
ncbi:MAG: exodeoxyribonuclease VII small subunit [Pirellula sp.]|jgi:exodeoxyribonuclease VII small subunit|nr:exodeoxyribonuclease VII small subunit [Planctomycetota bacterium]